MAMKKLLLLFLLLLLLLMVSILCPTAEAAPPPEYLVKRNCRPTCGNVVIPYPFGIGERCYMDEWYSVDCRNASGAGNKPFLNHTRLNLELLDVSLDYQTLTVNSPVASYQSQKEKGGSNKWQQSIDLDGSPFVFSSLDNKFVVLGCGNAKLTDHRRTWAGCASICSSNFTDTGCYGIDCCQTSIPTKESYYLNWYNVNFTLQDEGNGSSSTPIYAFLGDSRWLSRNFIKPEDVTAVKYAPLTLFWIFKEWDNISSYVCNGTAYYSPTIESYYLSPCGCPQRYEGNPYLTDGCSHVIKECADCLETCPYVYNTSSYTT